MATKEAQAQLALLPERVGILETKVENINEKLIDLKTDVKEMHDCLDNTRESITAQLTHMLDEYRVNRDNYYAKAEEVQKQNAEQHGELAKKIKELEGIRTKWTMYAMSAISFLIGAGLIGHRDLPSLLKFFGL
jgi:uncharacterized coiled-coil DUF342 family protein